MKLSLNPGSKFQLDLSITAIMSVRILVCKQQKSIPANLIEKEFILKI